MKLLAAFCEHKTDNTREQREEFGLKHQHPSTPNGGWLSTLALATWLRYQRKIPQTLLVIKSQRNRRSQKEWTEQ